MHLQPHQTSATWSKVILALQTQYIGKATILCDQCEYPPEARNQLPRDAIVIGLPSKEAYYKRIEKDSELMLEEAIEITQNQDATAHQVGYMRPEFKGEPLQMEVHKLQGNRQSRASQNRQQSQKTSFQWSETRKVKEGNLFLLWSETVTSQKWVSGKEGKVLQVWEGRALRFRVQIIE